MWLKHEDIIWSTEDNIWYKLEDIICLTWNHNLIRSQWKDCINNIYQFNKVTRSSYIISTPAPIHFYLTPSLKISITPHHLLCCLISQIHCPYFNSSLKHALLLNHQCPFTENEHQISIINVPYRLLVASKSTSRPVASDFYAITGHCCKTLVQKFQFQNLWLSLTSLLFFTRPV